VVQLEELRIMPIGPGNLADRVELCWSHLQDRENHELVKESLAWLESINSEFSPSTFIAYRANTPVGMIEFLPRDMLHHTDLCPCRKRKGGERRVLPPAGTDYRDYLFITCLWVPMRWQHQGVGNSLLMQLLDSRVFKHFRGALVFASDRDPKWPEGIHWPAGPREFYERAGFKVAKRIENPPGHLLIYERKTRK
jgi:ribosomal protein S18 acetylase RimI-like enzyme